MHPHQATIAHHLTHHDPIFLLHKALIPFLIGASSREGDLLTHTIGSDFFIDKLPAIIGIKAQDRKGEACPGTLESCQHCRSPTVEQRQTFRPPGGDIGQSDGVEATALQLPSTMGDQIDLQEAWFGFVPLGECPNRDLLLEQGTCFGGRKAMGVTIAMGLQQAVRGRCAHREEKATVFFIQLKVSVFLQGFDDAWQERDQAFRANAVECLPDQYQRLFHLWPIASAECRWRREDLLAMVEQPPGIFVHIPGGGHKLFQNQLLVGPRCLVIRRRNLLEQDPSGLRPQSVSHVFLLSVKQPEIACDRSSSAASHSSSFYQEYSACVLVWPEVIGTLVASWQCLRKPERKR